MYISNWLQSILAPRKWDVCGFILPLMSIWHYYILKKAKNPFIVGGYPSIDAAVEVLIYCTLDVAGARRLFRDKVFRKRHTAKILKRMDELSGDMIFAAVREYTEECLKTPTHDQIVPSANNPAPKSIGVPEAWVLVEYICNGDTAKIDYALNQPLALTWCLFDARRAINGDDSTVTSEEKEERIDAKLALMEKKKKEKVA